MREDIKLWLEALRSGKYKQTKGALEFNGGFCCLGVYCKVSGIPYDAAQEDPDQKYGVFEDNFDVYTKLRGLIDVYPLEYGIEMNDEGKSFAEIADMIEEHYKNV